MHVSLGLIVSLVLNVVFVGVIVRMVRKRPKRHVIILGREEGTYYASLADKPKDRCLGQTEAEALGVLLRTEYGKFRIRQFDRK